MLRIGFEIQVYKQEKYRFESFGDRLHLIDDVHDVIVLGEYMKTHMMPCVHQ
jgi:hypothetical protein